METKFTVRDVLVYLLTGLAFFVLILPLVWTSQYRPDDSLINTLIHGFDFWKSILAIPIIYLFGHIIDCLDLVRLKLASFVKPMSGVRTFWSSLTKFFYFLLVGDRVTGLLYFKPVKVENDDSIEDFDSLWYKANFLQIKNQFNVSEYWYVTKDLFNAL